MADYYSILEKTIAGLPNNTPAIRSAVYKKARTAIETQLRNMDPLPSEDAITSQLTLLEEAIVLIDAEHSGAVPPLAEAPVEQPVPTEPEPQSQMPQAEPVSNPAPAAEPVPEPVPEPITPPAQAVPASPAPAPKPVLDGAGAPAAGSIAPKPSIPASQPISASVDDAVDGVSKAIDDLADNTSPPTAELDDLSKTPINADPASSIAVDPDTKDILDPIVNADKGAASVSGYELEEKKSGGFFGGLIKLLLLLGILGGAGYALWKNKDELTQFASGFMKPAEESEVVKVNEPEPVVPTPEPVAPQPEPVVPEITEPEVTQPESVEPETQEPEIVEPEIIIPEPVPSEETTPEVTQPETVTQETDTATEQSAVIPIGEVAYLYEEGSAGSGATRTNAAIVWSNIQESPGEGNAPEPVIIGKMDIPDRGISIDIKIKRNIDTSISASHMIELGFNLPNDFAGQSVESIARFVMKTTEEATGEPLVAVPVKVAENRFLIALDNLTQAVALNTQLLKGSSWIDVPVVYGTGRRALITLEKGGTGERAFNQAFNDWQNR
jgi:outer membrane biosynthesis protein TonB